MVDQKADELRYINAFLASTGLRGTPVPQPDGDGPDFVLEAREFRAGVEITELWREASDSGLPRRQVEGTRDQVLRSAEQESARIGLPSLEVIS